MRTLMRVSLVVVGISTASSMINGCAGPEVAEREQPIATRAGLPVLRVVQSGATKDQAARLMQDLGVEPAKGILDEHGAMSFVDVARFQHLPTRLLGTGRSDEDDMEVTLEGLDFGAIRGIRVIDRETAVQQLASALEAAGLLPGEALQAVPEGHHTVFEAQDLQGEPIIDTAIDTSVTVGAMFEGIPLHGPGAKISATFDGKGTTTQLRYSARSVTPGDTVPIVPADEAAARCAQAVQMGHERIEPSHVTAQLVYYAPALAHTGVHSLVPFYVCSGSGGEDVTLLNNLIPATDDPSYVPRMRLDAVAEGDTVRAAVAIEGGQPPYGIEWSSSSTDIDSKSDRIEYRIFARERVTSETLTVTVTDANGVFASASQTLPVSARASLGVVLPLVGGVRDFGAENAVNNEFGRLDKGFVDEMNADGVTQRFVWLGTNAWEQDFKSPGDSTYVDNTDITFYVGHGYGGGFTFEDTSHDDGALLHTDATGDWGDTDLEWLALLSCEVLRNSWGGQSHFGRWMQEFDGLHNLLGFHTVAYAWSSFSGAFAHDLVDHGMTVRQAWFDAVADEQPDCVEPVVMGVFGNKNGLSNSNDHFWGHGAVGPDIRGSNVGGYWSIRVLKENPCS
ncbi:MAG TPA: DUF6345 domain-containing protein [Haliangium sp.]|nr:DUF6345 domain-containing protein [Haliangium sp.]